MKHTNASSHNRIAIQKSLSDFLSHVPGLLTETVDYSPPNSKLTNKPDLELEATLPLDGETKAPANAIQGKRRLAVESVRHTSPSLLEAALALLKQYVESSNQEQTQGSAVKIVPILFAPYLTPIAIDRCTKAGVSCLDAVGNGRIALSAGVYIERIGQKNTLKRKDEIANLFVPKSERVLRVLLNAAGALQRTWRIQPLAEESGVSVGQVARVKSALQESGYIKVDSTIRRQGGFHLIHPEELLQEWAAAVRQKRYRVGVDHTYNAVDSKAELKRSIVLKIPDHQNRVALSGLPAAERYAPFVVSPLFTAYVVEKGEGGLELMEEALDLQAINSGINVVLTVPRDEGVLYLPEDIRAELISSPENIQAVSPIQAYLDLQRLGGRANEGAQYLLERYLRPRWQKQATMGAPHDE